MSERTCTVDGCDKPLKARGWCQNHYVQSRRSGLPPSGVPISCGDCGRSFRPQQGRGHTICWNCRQRPTNDYSPRPCNACGETFTPRPAPCPAALCPPCQVANKTRNAADRRRRNPAAHREYQRRYKAANPDYQRRWVAANPEKARASNLRAQAAQALRDAANPEAARRQRHTSWQRYRLAVCSGRLPERFRDPEKQRRDAMLRRARKYGVEYERFLNVEVFDRDDWTCQLCADPIDPALKWPEPGSVSLDHIVPLSRGGGHTRVNSQAAHIGCNWRKYVNDAMPSD